MSPAGNYQALYGGAVATVAMAAVSRPAGIIMVTDATYYGVVPDVCNQSGKAVNVNTDPAVGDCAYAFNQGAQYIEYWKNIGNSDWSWSGATTTVPQALEKGPNRHNKQVNCQFVDGHTKAIPYDKAVGDICLWTTDVNAPHNCN